MNKKLFFGLFATTGMLLATSCTNEEPEMQFSGEMAKVSILIEAPDGALATRAIGDGSGVDALYWSVYDADGNLMDASDLKSGAFASTNTDGDPYEVVDIRLVKGQSYSIVFWAQSSTADCYTISQVDGEYDLQSITVNYSGTANAESRDAFFGKQTIAEVTNDRNYTVTLTRPFAQVNVGVDTQEWANALAAGVEIEESAIGFTDIPNKLNALTGVASGSATVDYTFAAIPSTTISVDTNGDNTDESLKYLTFAYILAHTGSNTTDATLKFLGTDDEVFVVEVDKMPFQRNYRTNIFGHILTRGSDFTVVIDGDFDNDTNLKVNEEDVNGVAALQSAMAANTSTDPITYNIEGVATSPVEVTIPNTFVSERVTLNFVDIANGATLTINGGTFAGTAIINAPESVTITTLTVNMPSAHVVLNKGNYTTVVSTTSGSTLVVGAGVKITTVEVKAGNVTIKKEAQVEKVAQEASNANTVIVYVEENATAPAVEGQVNIYEENKNGAGDNVYTLTLNEDLNLTDIYTITESVILDGNGHTLTSSAPRAINVNAQGSVTIKNLNIVTSAERAINIIQKPVDLTIENVTATSGNYTVNLASSAAGAKVAIKNSTLTGLNIVNVSAQGAQVSVDGTTLNCADTTEEIFAALCLNKDAVEATITATNCTFNLNNSDSQKARNTARGGEITIDGSSEEVVTMVAVITYPGSDYYNSFPTVESAIDAAVELGITQPITLIRQIVVDGTTTLDLKGKKVVATDNFEMFKVVEGGLLTISGGTLEGWSSVIWNDGGQVVIESGDYIQTGSAIGTPSTYRYCLKTSNSGTTIVNGGNFTSHNGIIDAGANVVINGGEFNNDMTGYVTTRHMAYVSGEANLTINGGEFRSVANSSAGGECICIYTSQATVTIAGGMFTSLWSTGSKNSIISQYAGGSTIVVDGGYFNSNGGITTFVEANTDPTTMEAYPWVAK